MAKKEPSKPRVVVIAGPNGAGKSTIAPNLLTGPLRVPHYVNADVIARGLSEFNADEMAIAAGKIMLRRLRELAESRESFAFETTLASRTFAPWVKSLIDSGYSFHLIYLWLPNLPMAFARVRERIATGGHGIPEPTIERRYYRGIRNFFDLYRPMSHKWRVYNNGGFHGPALIASGEALSNERVHDAQLWRKFTSHSSGC